MGIGVMNNIYLYIELNFNVIYDQYGTGELL